MLALLKRQYNIWLCDYANKYEIYADIMPDAPDTNSIMLKIMPGLSARHYW